MQCWSARLFLIPSHSCVKRMPIVLKTVWATEETPEIRSRWNKSGTGIRIAAGRHRSKKEQLPALHCEDPTVQQRSGFWPPMSRQSTCVPVKLFPYKNGRRNLGVGTPASYPAKNRGAFPLLGVPISISHQKNVSIDCQEEVSIAVRTILRNRIIIRKTFRLAVEIQKAPLIPSCLWTSKIQTRPWRCRNKV